MPTTNKKSILSRIRLHIGCNSCRRPTLSAVSLPKPTRRLRRHSKHLSSTSSNVSTAVSYTDSDLNNRQQLTAICGFGMAVEKDSEDPYTDFRSSILQMILEKEIYDADDLRLLLHCFLHLNSPHYHAIIVRVFMEIFWSF